MFFLENLDFLMHERKLNRSKLSKEVKISTSTIHNWYHTGYKNISLENLIKLSRYFNVTIDELVSEDISSQSKTLKVSENKEVLLVKNIMSIIDDYKSNKIISFEDKKEIQYLNNIKHISELEKEGHNESSNLY